MYNQYDNSGFYHNQFVEGLESENLPTETKKSGILSNIKSPELSMETIILFAVIFFCVYDDFDTELLIIIGALFFLGL